MERIWRQLEKNNFHKLIIGAALKDFEFIEKLSYVYAKAGADAIDISAFPNSVIYALKGISRAKKEGASLPSLMVSVNVDEDPHFRRIELDTDSCTDCMLCVETCPSLAFSGDKTLQYDEDLCFGCSACLPACDYDALQFKSWSAFDPKSLKDLASLGADAIEIHLGLNLDKFASWYRDLEANVFALESFCIGSEQLDKQGFLKAVDLIITEFYAKYDSSKRMIIQVDGVPMSGARLVKDTKKDELAIENAALVKDYIMENYQKYASNIFIQVAGGVTENTFAKAFDREVLLGGVAIGSYLRQKISGLEEKQAVEISSRVLADSKQKISTYIIN